jgi:hypothetical protein
VATQSISKKSGSGVLNVLLHGAFTFVNEEETNYIRTLVPFLEHHVYRAGNWLAETELRGREDIRDSPVTYELRGVDQGRKRFVYDSPDFFELRNNIVIKFGNLPDNNQRTVRFGRVRKPALYATIILPIPRKITSLRLAKIPIGNIKDSQLLQAQNDPEHMANLQIFTYDFKDDNALRLQAVDGGRDHFWEPAFIRDYINLHIFSSEDHYCKLSNAQDDFNRCVDLLGVSLQLQTRFLPDCELIDPGVLKGVTAEETEELAIRNRRMARLGRLLSRYPETGDTNLVWRGNDALDGSGDACGDCWGAS